MRFVAQLNEREHIIEVIPSEIDARFVGPESVSVIIDGKSYDLEIEPGDDDCLAVRVLGRVIRLNMLDERKAKLKASQASNKGHSGVLQVKAPMPGKIVRVLVKPGDMVEEGQGLLMMEAMKMENELKADRKAHVQEVLAQPGQSVESGALLLIME